MAIKKFEDKSLSPNKGVTSRRKNAIIETKEKYCYTEHGITVEAKSREEADKKIKKIIK